MLLGKNGILAIFFLASSCVNPPTAVTNVELESKRRLILEFRSSDFKVLQIEEESSALRVNMELLPPASTESEIKRRTLNALMEIQTVIGTADRLAVWAYQSDQRTVQGMAFYSPVSEQYHFKTAGEIH